MTFTLPSLKARSMTLKILVIGLIMLIMMIPITDLGSLIHERSSLSDEAARSISQSWGGAQHVAAPILMIPYRSQRQQVISSAADPASAGRTVLTHSRHQAYVLADQVRIESTMDTEVRYLGIYDVPVYTASHRLTGRFVPEDLESVTRGMDEVLWDEVRLLLPVSDVRGIRFLSELNFAGQSLAFQPARSTDQHINAVTAEPVLDASLPEDLSFEVEITLAGSESLNYLPLARETQVSLQSAWSSPGFSGHYLPASRRISEQGFTASWQVLHLNRGFPQQWSDQQVETWQVMESAFGVRLYQPAGLYQQNLRSVKYAALFIALTFMALFLFEVFFKLNLHPLQYLLCGGALSVFYLLLLALSEHLGFSLAYLIAGLAVVALMTGYCSGALASRRLGLLVGVMTGLLYGFLYLLIRSEENALLLGALGLFAILSLIMLLTRKLDWYRLGQAHVPEQAT